VARARALLEIKEEEDEEDEVEVDALRGMLSVLAARFMIVLITG
jgi:predicted thioesterase